MYPDTQKNFVRYQLDQDVVLPAGEFYIGYEQLVEERLAVGYDKNTTSGESIFYNLGDGWVQNEQFPGSLMMHPIFSNLPPQDPLSFEEGPDAYLAKPFGVRAFIQQINDLVFL